MGNGNAFRLLTRAYSPPPPPEPYEQLLALASAAGAIAVYDADNPNTLTLRQDGGVSYAPAVADGLGNLLDLVQVTEANQPILATLSTGRRVLQAPSGNRHMSTSAFTELTQPNTILLLARFDNNSVAMTVCDGIVSDKRNRVGQSGSGNALIFAGQSSIQGAALDTNWSLLHAIADGASSSIRINDGSATTGNAGTNGLTGLRVMVHQDGSTASLTGEVGAIVVFDSRKTAEDLADLRAHLLDTSIWPIGSPS